MFRRFCLILAWLCASLPLAADPAGSQAPKSPAPVSSILRGLTAARSQVVIVRDDEATEAFETKQDRVIAMVHRAVTNLVRQGTVASAWRSLVSTQDVVGIKVYSAPGPNSGTRPAVVAGVVEGLLEAGVPPKSIIVWDAQRGDLRRAGYYDMPSRYGIRVESSMAAGYDEKSFYDTPLLGQLVWGDLEFGHTAEGLGRKSFVSKLVSREITKIINITPLLNHNSAGVSGNLYSLAMGSVDNTHRFEMDAARLAMAVPEIYALPSLSDRVVLNVVDALICQYQGEQRPLLHYSKVLNEIRVSKDPVALDVLSLAELNKQRRTRNMIVLTNSLDLYQNASLLELGISDPAYIQVERLD
jgi:hypothetical protein